MRLRLVCLDTDDYKYLRFERIVEQMKQAQGITEQLKAENQDSETGIEEEKEIKY